jgi:molybdopterin-binding protein
MGQARQAFVTNLEALLRHVGSIDQRLRNNSFLSSECGRDYLSNSALISAMGDMVASVAPIALVAATVNPNLRVALPYILGFTGIGSVAQLIRAANNNNTLDMHSTQNRRAVLTNVCEFSKIAKRIRVLQLLQSGQLTHVQQALENHQTYSQQTLRENFDLETIEASQVVENLANDLRLARHNAQKLIQQIDSLLAQTTTQEASARINPGHEITCLMTLESIKEQNFTINSQSYAVSRQILRFQRQVSRRQQNIFHLETQTWTTLQQQIHQTESLSSREAQGICRTT